MMSHPIGRPDHQPICSPAFLRRGPGIARWMLLAGLLLAAAGASFAPWVARPSAALVLTAPDLAEFVKFLPEVRDGSLTVQRLFFLSPLFAVSLALPLAITACALAFPQWVRWIVLAATVPLALTLLPPVWSPDVLLSPEFRLQTMACVLCLGLVGAARWLGRIPYLPLAMLLLGLSLAAPILALWQFFTVREAIARAYASAIFPGWGAWLNLAGSALTVISMLISIRRTHLKDSGVSDASPVPGY